MPGLPVGLRWLHRVRARAVRRSSTVAHRPEAAPHTGPQRLSTTCDSAWRTTQRLEQRGRVELLYECRRPRRRWWRIGRGRSGDIPQFAAHGVATDQPSVSLGGEEDAVVECALRGGRPGRRLHIGEPVGRHTRQAHDRVVGIARPGSNRKAVPQESRTAALLYVHDPLVCRACAVEREAEAVQEPVDVGGGDAVEPPAVGLYPDFEIGAVAVGAGFREGGCVAIEPAVGDPPALRGPAESIPTPVEGEQASVTKQLCERPPARIGLSVLDADRREVIRPSEHEVGMPLTKNPLEPRPPISHVESHRGNPPVLILVVAAGV